MKNINVLVQGSRIRPNSSFGPKLGLSCRLNVMSRNKCAGSQHPCCYRLFAADLWSHLECEWVQKTESSKNSFPVPWQGFGLWSILHSIFLYFRCVLPSLSQKNRELKKRKKISQRKKENSWPIKSTVKHHCTEVIGDKSTSETSVGCLTPWLPDHFLIKSISSVTFIDEYTVHAS